mmetsp:Transcript_23836/g.34961  ORF Transcript_23836/g.34961 Transcript_23836/m.34961 type:complete len:273 (-) Transcript_23836:151-969(-)
MVLHLFLLLGALIPLIAYYSIKTKYANTKSDFSTRTIQLLKPRSGPLPYNPLSCEAINNFESTKRNSPCIFARKSILWGSTDFDCSRSLESNIESSLFPLSIFTHLVANGHLIDGFLYEIKGEEYGHSVESLSRTLKRTLKVISDNDPLELRCMNMKSMGSTSWYFTYSSVSFFITTFAKFYPQNHSRHMYSSQNSCFILLQPELSFLYRKIGPDSPTTQWDHPTTIRDKIRVSFRDHGMEYKIPPSLHYSVASTYVSPLNSTDAPVQFWKY